MDAALKRVRAMQERVGSSNPGGAPKPEVDTSGMSDYQKGQYYAAKEMAKVREDIARMDRLTRGGGKIERAEKLKITQSMQRIDKQVKELRRAAEREGKTKPPPEGGLSDYDTLVDHWKKTQALNPRAGGRKSLQDGDDDYDSVVPVTQTLQDLKDQSPMGEALIDPREDEEFQQFFQQTAQLDQEIEEGLERVLGGVQRLHRNARQIGDTLQEQNRQLEKMNEKADQRLVEMQSLNRKMKQTLKEVEKDKFCCYFICLLVALGIVGVIVTQTGVI